jgi:hypothetical protein
VHGDLRRVNSPRLSGFKFGLQSRQSDLNPLNPLKPLFPV